MWSRSSRLQLSTGTESPHADTVSPGVTQTGFLRGQLNDSILDCLQKVHTDLFFIWIVIWQIYPIPWCLGWARHFPWYYFSLFMRSLSGCLGWIHHTHLIFFGVLKVPLQVRGEHFICNHMAPLTLKVGKQWKMRDPSRILHFMLKTALALWID